MKRITVKIGLAGNPNVGKTTLFNTLTGLRHHVGNWPGKTVEKKMATLNHKGKMLEIVDLPGTYSLTPYSAEEIITRNFIIGEKPDVIVQIVDSTNFERNLYLTLQLLELGANVVMGLNFSSSAKKKGMFIDEKKLSLFLGIPVLKVEAKSKEDSRKLLDCAVNALNNRAKRAALKYELELEEHIEEVQNMLKARLINKRGAAIKILEHDDDIIKQMFCGNHEDIVNKTAKIRHHIENIYGEGIEEVFAKARYGVIQGIEKSVMEVKKDNSRNRSDLLDNVFLHRFFGLPLFFFMMFVTFSLTFKITEPVIGLIEELFDLFKGHVVNSLLSVEAPAWTISFFTNAVINGVGAVVMFLPSLFILFFLIAFLEDSGYMARAAFLMDRFMKKIGLQGKSFIPMILGFGCNVPAIMAARTIRSKKDRLITILINPFMSCSARLPLYVLFAGIFFKNSGLVVFSLYLLGIIFALIAANILNKIFFKSRSESMFVLELPPYRVPRIYGMMIHAWEKSRSFLAKASTVIFLATVLVWVLGNLPLGVPYASQESFAGRIGSVVSPLFDPLGFGTWQSSVSLLLGVFAKEIILGTLGVVYSGNGLDLSSAIMSQFTPLSAYSFMVYVLLYVPCISTLIIMKKELGSWKWPLYSVASSVVLAYIISFVIYQGGLLLGLG